MKNLFCKRLAACLCMKSPPSPSVEPPLFRNTLDLTDEDHINNDPSSDHDDATERTTRNDSQINLLIETHQLFDARLKEIRDLLKSHLHTKEKQRYEDVKEIEIKKDWILAANVIDRICAIAFSVIFIGGTLIFFTVFANHP